MILTTATVTSSGWNLNHVRVVALVQCCFGFYGVEMVERPLLLMAVQVEDCEWQRVDMALRTLHIRYWEVDKWTSKLNRIYAFHGLVGVMNLYSVYRRYADDYYKLLRLQIMSSRYLPSWGYNHMFSWLHHPSAILAVHPDKFCSTVDLAFSNLICGLLCLPNDHSGDPPSQKLLSNRSFTT